MAPVLDVTKAHLGGKFTIYVWTDVSHEVDNFVEWKINSEYGKWDELVDSRRNYGVCCDCKGMGSELDL